MGCLRWANSADTCERLLAHPSCNGAVVRLQANLDAHDRFAAAACMTAVRHLAAHPMGRRRLLDPKQVRDWPHSVRLQVVVKGCAARDMHLGFARLQRFRGRRSARVEEARVGALSEVAETRRVELTRALCSGTVFGHAWARQLRGRHVHGNGALAYPYYQPQPQPLP